MPYINPLWLVLLLCPLIHVVMMLFMRNNSCHGSHGSDHSNKEHTHSEHHKEDEN